MFPLTLLTTFSWFMSKPVYTTLNVFVISTVPAFAILSTPETSLESLAFPPFATAFVSALLAPPFATIFAPVVLALSKTSFVALVSAKLFIFSTVSFHVIVLAFASYTPPAKSDFASSIAYGNVSTIVTSAFPI